MFWSLVPPFFAHPFFLFLPCPPHPSPANFLPQNPLFLGPQIYSFLVEKWQPAGARFWGRFWTSSPHTKKRKILFKAKSGNLNLFLHFALFSLKIAGKTREKRAKCPENGLDYQILPFFLAREKRWVVVLTLICFFGLVFASEACLACRCLGVLQRWTALDLGSVALLACRQEASITWCDLFRPKFGQKMPKIISLHDVLEPLKQALLASRDVIISSQICGSKLQKVFTLGDGCWLPSLLRWAKCAWYV